MVIDKVSGQTLMSSSSCSKDLNLLLRLHKSSSLSLISQKTVIRLITSSRHGGEPALIPNLM